MTKFDHFLNIKKSAYISYGIKLMDCIVYSTRLIYFTKNFAVLDRLTRF